SPRGPAHLLSRRRSARAPRPGRAADHHGSSRRGRPALRRPAAQHSPQARTGHAQRHDPARHGGPKRRRQHERGSLWGDRIFLWRPLGQKPLDQPSRNPAAHLRAGGTANSDAHRPPGGCRPPLAPPPLPRLSPGRPAAADAPRRVVGPPPAANRPTTHRRWRSIMTTNKHIITIAAACVGLAALLTYAGAAQPLKVDFSDETVGGEPKSFVSVVGVWRIESDGNNK